MNCVKKNLYVKKVKVFLFIFLFIFLSASMFGAVLITGDENAAEGQTFSFNTGPHVISSSGESFYITSTSATANEYTISRVKRDNTQFEPLTPELVEIGGQEGQSNPLYNADIKTISLLEDKKGGIVRATHPVVVVHDSVDSKDKIYVVDLSKYTGVLPQTSEADPCKKKSKIIVTPYAGILGADLATEISEIGAVAVAPRFQRSDFTPARPEFIFAAVDIGESHGGIAVLQVRNFQISKNKSELNKSELEALEKEVQASSTNSSDAQNAQNADKEQTKYVYLGLVQGFTQALNESSSVVKIGEDLVSIDVTDMYWDNMLGCLYIALQVTAGGAPDSGCKALVLGKIEDGEFVLKNFTVDEVLQGTDEIVGARGADEQVSLHKVRTMLTSTRLSYVVVLGKNGDTDSTKKSVYALPLVKDPGTETHGMLANKNSLPEDLFKGGTIKTMGYRYLRGAATTNDDIYKIGDPEATVGAGDLGYDIEEIFVVGDAVFAFAKPNEVENFQGGLFMSRALFDENGKIKRWTVWQNVSSSLDPLFGIELDPVCGNFLLVSGVDQDNVKTVKRTVWGSGDKDGLQNLVSIIGQEFPKDIAGVQGLFEFQYDSVGLYITMMVATGYKKIALVELARLSSGMLTRNTGDFSTNKQNFTDGTLADFSATGKVIVISGGALDAIGPIECVEATFATDNAALQGRLFVGGIGGVAVLVKSNGDGWDASAGLRADFLGLTQDMAFRTVGDFKFVRKMVQDGNNLYILTDHKLYRVDLIQDKNNFVTGELEVVEIADIQNINCANAYSSFSDFVVSEKLGILATSVGLFRVGNGKNISVDTELNWTQVNIPSYCGPVKQLLALSQTLREQDLSGEVTNGVLYVLSSYYGKNIAQFNRFTVNYTDNIITDTTIVPLPDYFVVDPKTGEGSNSYFVHYGTFRELFEDEGAMRYSSADKDLCVPPFVRLLPPNHQSGVSFPIAESKALPLSIKDNSDVVKILRSSTGPMFLAGDFGLKVNE